MYQFRQKVGKSKHLFSVLLSNLGKIGDNERQKPNIFLKVRSVNGLKSGRLPAFWRVHWWQVVGLFKAQDLPERWLWSSGRVFPPFCPLVCFAPCPLT